MHVGTHVHTQAAHTCGHTGSTHVQIHMWIYRQCTRAGTHQQAHMGICPLGAHLVPGIAAWGVSCQGPSQAQADLSLFAHQRRGRLPGARRPGWGRPQDLGGTWAQGPGCQIRGPYEK